MYTLTGPPGSGKTTLLDLLETDGMVTVHVGALIRAQAPQAILDELTKGNFADNDYVNQLVQKTVEDLRQQYADSQIILDAYPRMYEQARWLVEVFGANLQACILLKADKQFLIDNLNHRHRADDGAQVVEHRLQLYHEHVHRLIEYYHSCNVVVHEVEVSGKSLQESLQAVRRVLGFVQ